MSFTAVPTTPTTPQPTTNQSTSNRLSNSSPLNPSNYVNSSLNNSNNRRPAYDSKRDSSSSASSISKYHSRRGSEILDPSSLAILSGTIGGSFGRYPRSSAMLVNDLPSLGQNYRDSVASSDVAIDIFAPSLGYVDNSGSLTPNEDLEGLGKEGVDSTLLWDKANADVDDYMHDPDPELDRILDRQIGAISWKGVLNSGLLVVIVAVLLVFLQGEFLAQILEAKLSRKIVSSNDFLLLRWPIYRYLLFGGWSGTGTSSSLGWNSGGINGSGQVPVTLAPTLIDKDTPQGE